MFSRKTPKPAGEQVSLKITGMHCTSCSMNIDGELEEMDGIIKSQTSYPKSTCTVSFDNSRTSVEQIKQAISDLGYAAE